MLIAESVHAWLASVGGIFPAKKGNQNRAKEYVVDEIETKDSLSITIIILVLNGGPTLLPRAAASYQENILAYPFDFGHSTPAANRSNRFLQRIQ